MKTRQTLNRMGLARQLQDMALRIASGKPVKINGRSVRVPDHVEVKAEIEIEDQEQQIEIEIKWPATPDDSFRCSKGSSRSTRKKRNAS